MVWDEVVVSTSYAPERHECGRGTGVQVWSETAWGCRPEECGEESVSGVGERLLAGRLAVWLREGSCPLSVAWESDVLLWPVSEARIHGSRWKCCLSRKRSAGIWGSSFRWTLAATG